MSIKRIYCVIYGRVQGVGFRYFTQDNAERFHLTGWVRNTPEGNVECEAQGEEGKIKLFISQIEQGPPLSNVKTINHSSIPVRDGEVGFEVRY